MVRVHRLPPLRPDESRRHLRLRVDSPRAHVPWCLDLPLGAPHGRVAADDREGVVYYPPSHCTPMGRGRIIVMKPKRKVSGNLGRTQYGLADKFYEQIRKRIGSTRRCPFYNGSKYTRFDSSTHNELNPNFPNPAVPIEEFDFAFNKRSRRWGLQAYCKVCYKAYRDARIQKARGTWIHRNGVRMTDDEIRAWYLKQVRATMTCSVCKRHLSPDHFIVSRSMEKGLHNECSGCQRARGSSVREQEWLAEGDWTSWTRAVLKLHRSSKVRCAGWSRSVVAGECRRVCVGKSMHADHKIPLRAGGIHDAKNFQPLCGPCNERKSDQIDPMVSKKEIYRLVGNQYRGVIKNSDSIPTIERKLKGALVENIGRLIESRQYFDVLQIKKKEVNGQWDVNHAFRKGREWFKRLAHQ